MNCKYKLPCNWCDKFDKQCTEIDCKHNNTCDHDWIHHHGYYSWNEKEQLPIKEIVFQCRKCGETKIEKKYITKEN